MSRLAYPYGSETDLAPFFAAFGSEFRVGQTKITGILDTEYVESESTTQRVAHILIRTTDVNKVAPFKTLNYVVNDIDDPIMRLAAPGRYDYIINRIETSYGGMSTLICNIKESIDAEL